MSLLSSMEISTAALYAERTRLNTISSNIANVNTTRTENGGPYIRRTTVFGAFPVKQNFNDLLTNVGSESTTSFNATSTDANGNISLTSLQDISQNSENISSSSPTAKVVGIALDPRAPILKYDPGHPDANEEGYVAYPNIDITEEMVDLIQARRSFEANVVAFNVARNLAQKSLEIGRA